MFESVERGGTRKTGHTARVWRGVRRRGTLPSQKKMKFGIGGDAISRCVEGLAFFSLFFFYHVLNSSPTTYHHTLIISMQIWTNYETHIFKKWGGTDPSPDPLWPRQWLSLSSHCIERRRPVSESNLRQIVCCDRR